MSCNTDRKTKKQEKYHHWKIRCWVFVWFFKTYFNHSLTHCSLISSLIFWHCWLFLHKAVLILKPSGQEYTLHRSPVAQQTLFTHTLWGSAVKACNQPNVCAFGLWMETGELWENAQTRGKVTNSTWTRPPSHPRKMFKFDTVNRSINLSIYLALLIKTLILHLKPFKTLKPFFQTWNATAHYCESWSDVKGLVWPYLLVNTLGSVLFKSFYLHLTSLTFFSSARRIMRIFSLSGLAMSHMHILCNCLSHDTSPLCVRCQSHFVSKVAVAAWPSPNSPNR